MFQCISMKNVASPALEDLYEEGMECDPEFIAAKRHLLLQTAEHHALTPRIDERSGTFLQRVEEGDIDDDEIGYGFGIAFEGAEDGDWWLNDFALKIAMPCVDLRTPIHPEMERSLLFIDQPEVTRTFHSLPKKMRYKLALALYSHSAFSLRNGESEYEEPVVNRLVTAMQHSFNYLMEEIRGKPRRSNFDIL